MAFLFHCRTASLVFFAPDQWPWSCESPGGGIGTVIRIVVVAKSLLEVLRLAAIVAASGLALEDVDVEAHVISPVAW